MCHETNSVRYGSSDTCEMASLESLKGLTHPSDLKICFKQFLAFLFFSDRFTLKYLDNFKI